MKHTGIVRRIDQLGRIVIPIEMRRAYGFFSDAPVEIFPTEDGIELKLYSSIENNGTLFIQAALFFVEKLYGSLNGMPVTNALREALTQLDILQNGSQKENK